MELRGHAAVEKFSSMVILCVFSLLCSLAADLSPVQQEFSKIVQEQKDAQQQWQDAYKNAKTDEERSKLKYPSNEQCAPRVLAVAKKNPDDPAALDALLWIAENCRRGDELDAALPLLLDKYPNELRIGDVVSRLHYTQSKETEPFLRGLADKSSSPAFKGIW